MKRNQHDYVFFGPVQFRFFKTITYSCIDDYANFSLFKTLDKLHHKIACTKFDHYAETRNKTPIVVNGRTYSFMDTNTTNITHTLMTPLGYYDESGIIIKINTTEYNIIIQR
jgi:hypothetical protein